MTQIYQPVEREGHLQVEVGDYLYMWGGDQPDLPAAHNNEKKKSFCSVVEVCHLPTGEWVQKPTTGDPPLGVCGYAAAVIRNEIFFYGGYCGHDDCYHNSLYSFNVDTFNWKELSPTISHHGPMMKAHCHMVALKINGEDYLAVIGGSGPSSNNTPPQPGAQYSDGQCNEVHLYRLKTGEWTSPTVTGDRPPPISHFTLTPITNATAILFGGYIGPGRSSNDVYAFEFTDTSVKCTKFPNPGASVQWPKGRNAHSSVLINCSSGPHLLVVGGRGTNDHTRDCWLLNINKMEWKELTNIPDSVTDRDSHSLSIWNETQTTHWIIEFGGRLRGVGSAHNTAFIEIISSTGDLVVQSVLDINEYQKRRIQDAVGKWMEEGSIDLTVTRVNMLGAPGAGKTCSMLLLLNEDPPTNDTSTPIACPAVRATRVAVCDKTIWNRVTRADLLDQLAADLESVSQEKKPKEPPLPVVLSLPDNTGPDTEIRPDPSPTPQKKPDQAVSSETKVIKEDKEYHTEAVIQEILATKPKEIRKSDHWLYVIDSGGQPAYQELLPLFTRAASLNIITLDLSKPFNERFDLMYRIDGQYFPCHSKSTQLAFFQSAVSTGASSKPLDISCISKKPTHSMHLVLGTHYDKVSDATLKEKEEILKSSMSSLQSYLQNCVIHQFDDDSIIFPVNTIAASEERAKYSEEICKAIWFDGSDASFEIKIPIRWFAFELSLPEQSIVSVKEALSIGERYGMNEEDTKQALRYFHDVSLMLYYPEVTNVVFIDSKPILEILSQLLALTYIDDRNARALILTKPVSHAITKNLKEGFFNEDIFEHLKSKSVVFSLPEFQLCDLIKLLFHLNIITKLENEPKGHYFIPYALPSYNEPVSIKETNAKPLLIVWREEESEEILPVPTGLFPLTITHLLNQKDYVAKICPLTPEYYKFRDAMSLKIAITSKHTLHLINRYTHIEVYFTGPTQHCPLVRKLLTTAIDNSSDAMHLKHNYVNAFACPYNESCYCIIQPSEDGNIVNCTVCSEPATVSYDYWCWFSDTKIHVQDDELKGVHIADKISFLIHGGSTQPVNWEEYGIRITIPQGAVLPSDTVQVTITALVGGDFIFPEDTELVSAVYAINTSKPFLEPVKLEIQHCVSIETSSHCDYLSFSTSTNNQPPYQFDTVDGGEFSIGNRYGSISVTTFSQYSLSKKSKIPIRKQNKPHKKGEKKEPHPAPSSSSSSNSLCDESSAPSHKSLRPSLDPHTHSPASENETVIDTIRTEDEADGPPIKLYYGQVMYEVKRQGREWWMRFLLCKNLSALKEYIKKAFRNVERSIEVSFQFKDDDGFIELCFDDEKCPKGWSVRPHQDPTRVKQSVINEYGRMSPCFPECLITFTATPGEDAVKELSYPITLQGIKKSNFEKINIVLTMGDFQQASTGSIASNSGSLSPDDEKRKIAGKVLRRNSDKLSKILAAPNNLSDVIMSFYAKELISDTTVTECMNDGRPVHNRCASLLFALKATVDGKPQAMKTLIEVLKENEAFNEIADKMIQSLDQSLVP